MTRPSSQSDVRPPVDALSDVAWARVERGLWARMDRGTQPALPTPRRRWPVFAAAVVAIAAGVIAIVHFTGERDADSPLSHAIAHTPAPAPATPALPTKGSDDSRTRIVTDVAPTNATFGDVGVELAAETAIEYTRDPATAHVERGAAWFTVAPRGARPAFAVFAGDASIEVVGTRFHVTRELEHVMVEVDHGAVRVQFRGTTTLLHDGETWDSTPKAKPVKPLQPPPVPKVDARARFDELTALEARDPNGAIAGYVELAKQPSAWAELAAFAAARLAVDHHDARAAALLTDYLRRFPTGSNAADARQLLTRLKGP